MSANAHTQFVCRQDNTLSKDMPGSISIDMLDTSEGPFTTRLRTSTHSVDSWTIVTAASATLYRTSETDPASQAPAAAHARLRSQLPDTSADLTRNWLTTTAPPPFSRKGVADVVMPVKATRLPDDISRQRERAHSTSIAQQVDGIRRGYGRGRHAVSQLQPHGNITVQRSEGEERGSESGLTEERTLGWVTLSRGMSTGSSRRRPGLRERKNNGDIHEDTDGGGTVTSNGGVRLGVAGEGNCIEGRKLRRKWPWESFLKIAEKRLGKKDTL